MSILGAIWPAAGDFQRTISPNIPLGIVALIFLAINNSGCSQTHTTSNAGHPALPALLIEQSQGETIRFGSGTPIGDRHILTAKHVLLTSDRNLHIDSSAITTVEYLRPTPLCWQPASQYACWCEDWQILEIRSDSHLRNALNTNTLMSHAPGIGTQMVVAGMLRQDGVPVHIQGICTVIATPRGFDDCDGRLLFFKGPEGDAGRTGMSGGPAAIWDANANEYLLVGIYVGALRTSILGIPTPWRDIGVIRRITNDDLGEVGIQLPSRMP